MTPAELAQAVAAGFYGEELDFSGRSEPGGGWSELPEVKAEASDPVATRRFLTFTAAVDKMVDADAGSFRFSMRRTGPICTPPKSSWREAGRNPCPLRWERNCA